MWEDVTIAVCLLGFVGALALEIHDSFLSSVDPLSGLIRFLSVISLSLQVVDCVVKTASMT